MRDVNPKPPPTKMNFRLPHAMWKAKLTAMTSNTNIWAGPMRDTNAVLVEPLSHLTKTISRLYSSAPCATVERDGGHIMKVNNNVATLSTEPVRNVAMLIFQESIG